MLMHNPPHPGEIIKELCLEPLELSVTEAAEALGVSRKTLSSIITQMDTQTSIISNAHAILKDLQSSNDLAHLAGRFTDMGRSTFGIY